MHILVRIFNCLLAGAVGGLINSIALWGLGATGITPALGFPVVPTLTVDWLSPRLFFGALWGLLFLIPLLQGRTLVRGIVFSLAPSAYMLLVVFPRMGKGLLGLELSTNAPFFVFFFNALWGIAAAEWLRQERRQ